MLWVESTPPPPPGQIGLSNQSTTPAERNRGENTTAIAKVPSAFVGSDSLISGFLPVVPVKIRCTKSNEFITTLALLDNGSTSSFISESLIKALQAKNFSVINVSTATINQVQTTHKAKVINGLQISDLAQSNFFQLNPTLSINSIPVGKGDIPTQEDVNQFLEFKNVYIPLMDEEVGLLIGNDNSPVMQPLEVINTDAGYYAIKTPVGWTINCPKKNGVYPKLNKTFLVRLNNHPMCTLCTDVVDTNINNNQLLRDQTRFLNFVSTSIRHLDNQHYEIALPVRNSEIQLPLNRTMAEQRACYLKRKFLKNPAFFEHYKTFVNDMLVNNYAERVEGVKGPPGITWYIPHHGVYHPNKPQKIRVVFDCSAKYKGISLNDTLLPGPDITNKLLGVLIRFRSEVIAIEGDIKSMFHQIQISPCDRDKLRFLW